MWFPDNKNLVYSTVGTLPSKPSFLLIIHLHNDFDFGFSQDGKFAFYTNLPDTITTWVVQAVGISNQTGLGVARALNIQTFKDFFISLRLPYSVQRGEQISVIASVFNYANFDLKVKYTLVVSSVSPSLRREVNV